MEYYSAMNFPRAETIKNLPTDTGAARGGGSIPGLGRSPGEGNGNPLQYSCLETSMDRGVWWAALHGVTKIWTQLSTHALLSYKKKNEIRPFATTRMNLSC